MKLYPSIVSSQFRFAAMLLAISVISFPGQSARAAVISAESSAYGIFVDLDLTLLNASLGPFTETSGTAPGTYDNSNSSPSASVDSGLNIPLLGFLNVIDFDTGLLEVTAGSNVDGAIGNRVTDASATTDNVNLMINSVVGAALGNFIELDATVIQSTAEVTGDYLYLDSTGTTTIAGTHGVSNNQALLTVAGVDFLLDSNPAPNTLIQISASSPGLGALIGSIDVTLNEQITSGDGTFFESIEVNALHLEFNALGLDLGLLGTGLLSGDVIISNSQANMSAVPEPSSMCLLACVSGLGLYRRRRSRIGDQSSPE